MATRPVRTISMMPKGSSTSTGPSILSSVPVISTHHERLGGHVHDPRPEDLADLQHLGALLAVGLTLISARSR
jgi:hypothetical protein